MGKWLDLKFMLICYLLVCTTYLKLPQESLNKTQINHFEMTTVYLYKSEQLILCLFGTLCIEKSAFNYKVLSF